MAWLRSEFLTLASIAKKFRLDSDNLQQFERFSHDWGVKPH